MTPWQWLADHQRRDLTAEQQSYEWIRTEMQHRYPGPYRIVRVWNPKNPTDLYGVTWVMRFDDPGEELLYRLRWN
jgi:hypothetical protein